MLLYGLGVDSVIAERGFGAGLWGGAGRGAVGQLSALKDKHCQAQSDVFYYGLVDIKTGYFVQFLATMYIHKHYMQCILQKKKRKKEKSFPIFVLISEKYFVTP